MTVRLHHFLHTVMMKIMTAVMKIVLGPQLAQPPTNLLINQVCVFVDIYCLYITSLDTPSYLKCFFHEWFAFFYLLPYIHTPIG